MFTESTTSPVVNGNGTDRVVLVGERKAAIIALRAAEQALLAVTVNGRDYIGDDARLRRATDAHSARLLAVRRAMEDLTAEVIALRG